MADERDVTTKLAQALAAADRCADRETSERFASLNEQLQELDSLARDTIRGHADVHSLARKLRDGAALTPDEMAALRLLMVGDADYYLKYDDDFEHWKSGLGKVIDEIRGLEQGQLDVETLMHLRVLCHEARSILTPTSYYLEQRERVEHFEAATRNGIDEPTGKILADMVIGMVAA